MPQNLIAANEFCRHHNIEISFIYSLHEYGLIEITNLEDTVFIDSSELSELEKFLRLHYELNINLEGIDAISHLLKKLETMQEEMNQLNNRLRFFEKAG